MAAVDGHPVSHQLDLGPWRIDLERGTVAIDSDVSGLSQRAESLLLLLCRHPNALVTREQILDKVWAGRVVEDAVINNCVWQIRQALGEHGKEFLQTRAKRGYVLAVRDEAWCRNPSLSLSTLDESLSSQRSMNASETEKIIVSVVVPPAIDSVLALQSRTIWSYSAVVVLLTAFILLAWYWYRGDSAAIALRPDAEMSVTVIAPKGLEWLRPTVLRKAVDAAYFRGGAVVVFERLQRSNPFAGPHLQVVIASDDRNDIDAELSLRDGDQLIRERFHGPKHELADAVHDFLLQSLAPAVKAATPADDALISGLTADLLYDHQGALIEYRRAVARDPANQAAKIVIASALYDQGKASEALALNDSIAANAALTETQRCEVNMLYLQLAPDRAKPPMCPTASALAHLKRSEHRDALRELDAIRQRPKGARQWLIDEIIAISAHSRLRETSEAEERITHDQLIAEQAGWQHARLDLDMLRAGLATAKGQTEDVIKTETATADGMQAVGDVRVAIEHRLYALRATPFAPGAPTHARRIALQALIDRTRAIGSIRNEVAALQLLVKLDRDRPDLWRSHLLRMRTLINDAYTPRMRTEHMLFMLDEVGFGLHYQEVLDGIAALESTRTTGSQQTLWDLTLRAEAHFARDELRDSVAAVDAMEREDFDLISSSPCLFAWMFVEAQLPDRARLILKQCPFDRYDAPARASRGDFGLLAQARLYQLNGEAQRAWPTLLPRIDSLLATTDLSRNEAESLALLARHSISMPGADRDRLQRAFRMTEIIATRDGAGPTLRAGVHLLRWRLCTTSARINCGPVLPPWAQENLLEARLAQQGAAR